MCVFDLTSFMTMKRTQLEELHFQHLHDPTPQSIFVTYDFCTAHGGSRDGCLIEDGGWIFAVGSGFGNRSPTDV